VWWLVPMWDLKVSWQPWLSATSVSSDLDDGDKDGPWNISNLNQLTRLAREYFINMIAALASGLAWIAAWRLNILRFLHHIPYFLEVNALVYFKRVSSIERFYVHLCLSNYSICHQLTRVLSFRVGNLKFPCTLFLSYWHFFVSY
jgi:hypothetical protein